VSNSPPFRYRRPGSGTDSTDSPLPPASKTQHGTRLRHYLNCRKRQCSTALIPLNYSVHGLFVPWTIRISYPGLFVPSMDYSYLGLFVPWTIRTLMDCSYHPWTFRTLDCSYRGLFVPSWTVRTMNYSYHHWTIRTTLRKAT